MKIDSKISHIGRDPQNHHGAVNIPPYRASTFLYDSLDTLWGKATQPYQYARAGTPSTHALATSIAALEGGAHAFLTPSGLSAITLAIMSTIKAGAHILVADSVYTPTRNLCNELLPQFDITTEYYDPCIGGGIAALIRPETCLIFTESPGSITFEMQDIPAITTVARKANIATIIDNTWGGLLNFNPFAHGIDLSIQSATKYIIGHADAVLGSVTANAAYAERLQKTHQQMGYYAAPDDIYLALRGLRTLGIRLAHHHASALTIAAWLRELPFVREVLFPPLADTRGHDLWKRDFSGGCGLLGFVMEECAYDALAAMVDNMRLFGMGYSWGGFESLIVPFRKLTRALPLSIPDGQLIRLHIGLEDVSDLQQDLVDGFVRAGFTL